MQWSRIKPFENNSWSRVPNFPIRSSGVQIFPLLGSLICPLLYQRAPQMFHCAIKGPFSCFPHQVIMPPPHSFPLALLRISNFLIASWKGPKISIAPSRAPNFLIMSSKWWPFISHHVIKRSQFIIASSRGPYCVLQFPITLSRGPNLSLRHQRVPFPPSRHQRDPNFKIHHVYIAYNLWDMNWLKSAV